MKQTAVEWLWRWINDNQEATIEQANEAFEQAKQMENEQSLIWNKDNPKEDGDYICRMNNDYIKLCHYENGHWFDMWKWDIIVDVKEWMYVPYNK
jgi:hypothetical protein